MCPKRTRNRDLRHLSHKVPDPALYCIFNNTDKFPRKKKIIQIYFENPMFATVSPDTRRTICTRIYGNCLAYVVHSSTLTSGVYGDFIMTMVSLWRPSPGRFRERRVSACATT